MIDMNPPETFSPTPMRTIIDYMLACVLAFAAFLILYNLMAFASQTVHGAPTSHHATTIYLAIAGVSVAFSDPLGVLQQRDGWQGHLRGAAIVGAIGFFTSLVYFASAGV